MNPKKTFFFVLMLTAQLVAGGLMLNSAPAVAAEPPLTDQAVENMSAWCDNTRELLLRARRDAEISLYRWDYAAAESRLRQGLVDADAAGRRFRNGGPLTVRAISRGIQLSAELAAATAQSSHGPRTRVYFLFNYYDFLVDTVENLDLPLYLPYRHCGLCNRVNATLFEQRFVYYARSQLSLVLNTLAEASSGFASAPIVPVGSPEGFLKALELSAANTASDLRESLWSARYSCAASQLVSVSRELSRFNAGQVSQYYDEVDAVNRSYFDVDSTLHAMDDMDCGSRRR